MPTWDGIFQLGEFGTIYGSEQINGTYDYALRGVTLMGRQGVVSSPTKIQKEEYTWDNFPGYALHQGVLCAGGWFNCEVENRGVIIGGHQCDYSLHNTGVTIFGTARTKKYKDETPRDQKETDEDNFSVSSGIMIVGSQLKYNQEYDPNILNDLSNQEYVWESGFVKFSNVKSLAHEMRGHIKLGPDFSIVDANGKEIVTNGVWRG